MDIGILGLSASGKSTLFTLLTGQAADARHDAVTTGMASVLMPWPEIDQMTEILISAVIAEDRTIMPRTLSMVLADSFVDPKNDPAVPPMSTATINGIC